jgi:beta-1,4-N-acetylglucosaminyltransferase
VLLLVLRLVHLLSNIRRARRWHRSCYSAPTYSLRTLVVLGSGGHTTEILSLAETLEPSKYSPIYYCKAASDTTSHQRLCHSSCLQPFTIYNIPRSREVGQSYWSSIFTTIYAQLCAMTIVARLRPQLILCNGPGTCLPICMAAWILRFFGCCRVEVVFCESLCRVQTLSLTGRLLYPLVDVFLVHWQELHLRYPLTRRIQAFVKDT